MASRFCPVCYKVSGRGGGGGPPANSRGSEDPSTSSEGGGVQQIFFKLIRQNSVVGEGREASNDARTLEQFEKFGMNCCGECLKFMEAFCERHHQLRTAEQSLNRKLEKLKGILGKAQESSSNLMEYVKKLEVPEETKADMMGEVSEARLPLYAICFKKVTSSFSNVILDLGEALTDPEPQHGGGAGAAGLASQTMTDNLALGEEEKGEENSDVEESQPAKRMGCETSPVRTGADGKRKPSEGTSDEGPDEDAPSNSTSRIKKRRHVHAPLSSTGPAETPLSESNMAGEANLDSDDKAKDDVGGSRNVNSSSSPPTPPPVVPKTEIVDPDLAEGKDVVDIDISLVFQAQTRSETEENEMEVEDNPDLDPDLPQIDYSILQEPKSEAGSTSPIDLVDEDSSGEAQSNLSEKGDSENEILSGDEGGSSSCNNAHNLLGRNQNGAGPSDHSGSSSLDPELQEILKFHRRAPDSFEGDNADWIRYNCICGASSTFPGLKEHLRYKLYGRPYKCQAPGCDVAYGYRQFNNLVKHCKNEHGIQITAEAGCFMCGEEFGSKDEMKAHEAVCPKNDWLVAAVTLVNKRILVT